MPYEFACDAHGRVDLDAFDEGTRLRYLYARALIGLDYRMPRIEVCTDDVAAKTSRSADAAS